jgi:PAS domain S-box-containing protein
MSEQPLEVDSTQRFRSLFKNNTDLIVYQNEAGTILDANQTFLELVHRTRENTIGLTISDFLPNEELIDLFRRKLEEAFTGAKVQFEVAVQFKGAEPRVLHVSKVPLLVEGVVTGVHMIGRDITALTTSNQVIEKQARKLNTIFDSITDALFLLDREWHMTFLNQEVERLLLLDRRQVTGRNIWDVFPEELNGLFYHQYTQAIETGVATHFEAYFKRGKLWLEVKAFPSEEGLSVYFTDITARKEAELNREQMTKDLYHHNQDLQQFTYLVSHNLRAPLANALGLSRMLHTAEPAQAELVTHLQTSLEQLDTVLRDLNAILAVRDKQGVEPAELVPVASVLDQVLQSLQESLQQCQGRVTLALPPDLHVHGARAYLFSIFLNLLSNSIKYRSAERPLEVIIAGSKPPTGGTQLTITDNGSGFNRERAGDDVFKLYKRFHATPDGRGMGLFLVHTHVVAMGGHIDVQSTPGVGTRLTLLLP